MSALTPPAAGPAVIHYPDDDGLPMSDNTAQFTWINVLMWSAEAQFRADPDVFVAGNHLIYPVEGKPKVRQAPDVYVAFGPRKGDRGSYKVWEEGGVFPQVVFEVWSPHNRHQRMEDKRAFYDRYGAEEYYIVTPSSRCTPRGGGGRAGRSPASRT
jgi:Uma2 family endonuclease